MAEEKWPQADEEPEREKKKVTNNDRQWANLEQYILTQNIDKTQNYYTTNKNLFDYFTFRQINGPGPQLINKLRGIDNVNVFYKIKTSTLSLMQPKIKIYKVSYEDFKTKHDGTTDEKTLVSLPVPCYKEFRFSDTFGRETAATVEDYLAYESTKPTFRNVGLTSFSMEQDGETHGIIENNIKCTLVLKFKSLKDLNASPPGERGLRYVDLILWTPSKYLKNVEHVNPHHYEIKVLLGYTAPSQEQLNGLNLTANDIKAIANIEKLNVMVSLGLTDYDIKVNDNGSVDLTANYRGRLESSVGSNQVNIFQDSFRIGEKGNFEVIKHAKAKYNTSHVYKVNSAIKSLWKELNHKGCKDDDSCEARGKLRDLVATDKIFQDILKSALGPKKAEWPGVMESGGKFQVIGDGTDFFTWFKTEDAEEKLIGTIKKKIGLFKTEIYKSFVDQLIDGNPDEGGTRLFCVTAQMKDVIKSVGGVEEKATDKSSTSAGMSDAHEGWEKKVIKASTTAIGTGDGLGVDVGRCKISAADTAKVKAETAFSLATNVVPESKSKDKETGESKDDKNRQSTITTGQEEYKFYYVYLGDIIELACKNAKLGLLDFGGTFIFPAAQYLTTSEANASLDYPLQNARILLGPIEYLDRKAQVQKINLAQFPISFKFFRAWFLKKIVRRRRSQMPLGEFLAVLINDLVRPALGAGMPKSKRPRRVRANMVALTLPGRQIPDKTHKICGKDVSDIEEMLPLERVINIEDSNFKYNYHLKVTKPRSSESLIKTSFDYLLIHMTSSKNIKERSADPLEDVKDGIYHFNIGSDMGLLKNMTFKRANSSALSQMAELRSLETEEGAERQLEQLKFPYNTDLKLVGSSLFMPGMYYYVNPSLAGLGSVESPGSLAYQMNLGGYHIILKISTTISSGRYETLVSGMQTGQPRR